MHAFNQKHHKAKYTRFHSLVNKKLQKQPFGHKELAQKINISKSHMYRILQGERISFKSAKGICDILNIPYSEYKGLPEYIERCNKTGRKIGERAVPYRSKSSVEKDVKSA